MIVIHRHKVMKMVHWFHTWEHMQSAENPVPNPLHKHVTLHFQGTPPTDFKEKPKDPWALYFMTLISSRPRSLRVSLFKPIICHAFDLYRKIIISWNLAAYSTSNQYRKLRGGGFFLFFSFSSPRNTIMVGGLTMCSYVQVQDGRM